MMIFTSKEICRKKLVAINYTYIIIKTYSPHQSDLGAVGMFSFAQERGEVIQSFHRIHIALPHIVTITCNATGPYSLQCGV